MSLTRHCIAALAIAAAASPVMAGIYTAATYSANFAFGTPTAFVPLRGTGVTTVSFNSPKTGRMLLTFTAECAVDAPAGNTVGWVDIDIIVNGVAVAPTTTAGDAFCTADGVAGFSGWVRASITVPVSVVKGANSVRVLGRLNFGATGGWISDSTLAVFD